jgi:hypothetical protein
MRKKLIVIVAACLGFAGPGSQAHADLFSATGSVIAMLAGDLFVGEAEGHLSGAGTLAIHSQKDPGRSCVGQFTSSALLGGSGQLHCTDGGTAIFHFKRLTMLRGYGAGSFNRGEMSFAYGLSAAEAEPYLKLPAGKKLTSDGKELKLVDL